MKLFGKTLINWKKIGDVAPAERRGKILGAICHFMKSINDMPHDNVKTFAGADPALRGSDNPIAYRLTDTIQTPDRGYEKLFDELDMRAATTKSFDLLDITGGVTFYQVKEGEKAKLSRLPSAAKAAVSMLRFIGGFGIPDDWLRFNEYYKIDELAADTIRRWYNQKASLMYGLLAALGSGINQAFVTDDIVTINTACAGVIEDMEAAGYPMDENPSFWITCHPTLKMRIMKALAAAFLNPNSNNNQLVWPIAGVIATTKIANTSYYVSLPGRKNKLGEWEDLNAREAQRNELYLGADHVWTGAFNGAIGEAKQHKRCALS